MRHFKEKAVRLFKNAPTTRKTKFYNLCVGAPVFARFRKEP
jgi:hypothetical protein